jgi:hypothetical protein
MRQTLRDSHLSRIMFVPSHQHTAKKMCYKTQVQIAAETLNILLIYDWPWLHYLTNLIGSRSAHHCWLLNTEQQWKSVSPSKHVSRKLTFRVLAPSALTVSFLTSPRGMVSIYRNLIKIFWENRHFVFWGPCEGPLFFGTGMFMFIGHRPVTDKLLNTEYEQNPSNHSAAGGAHIHT